MQTSIATAPQPDVPTSVVFYPRSARVTVKKRVQPEILPDGSQAFQVALPARSVPSSLSVTIPGNGVAAISIRETESAPEAATSRVAGLHSELAALRRQAASLSGTIAATEARMALWAKPPMTNVPLADLERLDGQMTRRLADLNANLPELRERKANLQVRIDRVEQELRNIGADTGKISVATVLLANPAQGTQDVTYTYTLSGAGWKPTYRLEALPDKGTVTFAFHAEIHQGSSMDWSGVQLSVATIGTGTALQPPPMQAWEVRPLPEVAPAEAETTTVKLAQMDFKAVAAKAAANTDAIDEKATYELWNLGQRTLLAGTPVRVALRSETWPAVFRHTVRPAADPRAFLTAAVTLPEPRHYPKGEALFVADGASLGSAPFSLAEDKADIFFGSDPMVSATMRLDERKSGRQGLVNKQQTRVWDWAIEVANRRATPVSVRVEDPEPQPRDTAISISVESDPKPATEKHRLVWNLDVAPRSTSVIRHTVRATAPADMRLDDGR